MEALLMATWIIVYTACADPPNLNRTSCHGMRTTGKEYFSKAACEADIPRLLKEKHRGWRVDEPICVQQDCSGVLTESCPSYWTVPK